MISYITGTAGVCLQPFDGSGNFTRTWTWASDAAAGIKILASRHDTHDKDLADALSNTLCKDGQSSPLNDISWNNKKLINLANPANPTDAATKQYVDGVRNFGSAISITGSTPESRLKYTGNTGPWGDSYVTADRSFGMSGATWVWNEKADFSGTNDMALASGITPVLTLTGTDPGTGSGPRIIMNRDSASPAVNDYIGNLLWQGKNSLAAATTYAQILGQIIDPANNSEDATLHIQVMRAGTLTSAIAIGSDTTIFGDMTSTGIVYSAQSFVGNSAVVIGGKANGIIYLRPNIYTSATNQTSIGTDGSMTVGGNITASGGSISAGTTIQGTGYRCRAGTAGVFTANYFNIGVTPPHLWTDTFDWGAIAFSSDYRMKKDVQPLPSQWQTVKALKPISYTHQAYGPIEADDIVRWGFIAHELQETTVESAANGHKDEENVIQSPNPWTVIAALTSALQEAMTRIEALEGTPA